MSKSGFSTLNRWLGRKNKGDKTMGNGKLSKSSTNLSISSTNINETSQLEYNRITPLPAATTNAPFEQTFRITVLLPKDQLYVTRLGARVPLSKLLELVCDNKLLDKEKYEFRNPVDPSQVYSCDLTIGAVGLSEIRLCHKTESYDNFNSDEIIKLHRTSLIRESLSSSEFSSRNSKHTTKTTSPYSSTNSLNSMDSSAMSCGGGGGVGVGGQRFNKCNPKLTAPPRKKRAAPRPPKQTVITEKPPVIMENGHDKEASETANEQQEESPLNAKDLSISTPNLASSTLLHNDINGNNCNGHLEDFDEESSGNGSLNSHGYSEDTVLYAQIQKKNALNNQNQRDLDETEQKLAIKLPEPSPRKRIVVVKRKTTAAPAPPPRNSLYQEDNISLASTNNSSNSTPTTPIQMNFISDKEKAEKSSINLPTPLPRICTSNTTSTTLLNANNTEQDLKLITKDMEETKNKANVSKVLLNRTPTPEPRSLSCEPSDQEHSYDTHMEEFKAKATEEDCVSKQADSGIGEPVPSPLPDSLPSEGSTLEVKLQHFESSSDDDDMVKVYNFKLGKTLVKPVSETKTLEELTIMNANQENSESEISTPLVMGPEATPNTLSETSSWNFAIPISPPPNFADNKFVLENTQTDIPITPKIMERPVLNFEDLKSEEQEVKELKEKPENKTKSNPPTPLTPMDNIVQELNSVIMEKGGVEGFIRKTEEETTEIEAAKPNTLSNFTINAHQNNRETIPKPKEVAPKETYETSETDSNKPASTFTSPANSIPEEEEKLYRKRSSITSLKQRRSITRSDSFHSTVAPFESLNMNKRTSSQLSLVEQMAGNLNRRKSSSELSIGESPSLQSLEIIKTILNSRKNSLANSSGEEDKEIEVNARRPSEELKFASLELKTTKTMEKIEPARETQSKEFKNEEKPEQAAKEIPKVYRYSGPPSINFSTWSERPKSQVAIKNEGDYIFGGGKPIQVNGLQRISLPPPPVAPKPGPTQRMGIPEKEYKVPIMVKPLKDVIIDKQPNQAQQSVTTNSNAQRPSIESVLKPQTHALKNTLTRPSVEQVLRPQTQIITNTSTLPRTTKQRYSTPAGHTTMSQKPPQNQLLRTSSTKQCNENEMKQNQPDRLTPGPQILRSSSINRQNENEKPAPAAPTAPFGQNTLRRTGFKEKILAQEEKAQEKVSLMQNHFEDFKQTNQKFPQTITSAKLHLNLKQIATPYTTNHTACKTASPSTNCSSVSITLEKPKLKQKTNIPQTAPVLSTTKSPLSTVPPPPPPSNAMNSISLKTFNSTARTPLSPADPRDELLSAIRNFNKDGLKKA